MYSKRHSSIGAWAKASAIENDHEVVGIETAKDEGEGTWTKAWKMRDKSGQCSAHLVRRPVNSQCTKGVDDLPIARMTHMHGYTSVSIFHSAKTMG